MFDELAFRYPWRKYQAFMLARIEGGADADRRLHLVAPPGSGKTIIGLELIRRYGEPAVVFAPTATIRDQWRERLEMFTADQATALRLSTTDPAMPAPISIFTYQLISTPGAAREEGRRMAEQAWFEELVASGRYADAAAARQRIATLAANNASAHRREIDRHYLRLKRRLLTEEGVDVGAYLHPNARQLVDQIAAAGVRTVILDECHHLLDYWAVVLRYLIARLEEPRVVGLTATLPSPEDDDEYENYTSLLGDVDFEVPTPAVVKEGDLAPYRDLAYFVRPSERERRYLDDVQAAFRSAIADVTASARFRSWLGRTLFGTADGSTDTVEAGRVERHLASTLDDEPGLALAGLRFWSAIGLRLPAGAIAPDEAAQPPDIEDWSQLLERFGLEELKPSHDPEDHRTLARLRRALYPFGLTLTEGGLRQGRSAGDLVLSLSESKDEATARILAAEADALGDRLRAIVVTDFETMSARSVRVRDVIDRDAGSAFRVFRRLAGDPIAGRLTPVLVTGTTIRIPEAAATDLARRFDAWLTSEHLRAACRVTKTDDDGVAEIEGEGPDWSPGTYARMATAAFDEGHIRCLVGTRGIFGEGWDSLTLNTLVDLTSVTTATSVQQIRGRTLRLDPGWPRKVAHAWDVICVAPDWDRGDLDVVRFARRHQRTWGIISPVSGLPGDGATRPRQEDVGRVVREIVHVDFDLAARLARQEFKKVPFDTINGRMLAAVVDRAATYARWKVGDQYSNFVYRTTRIEPIDLTIRTVYTISDTLKALFRRLRLAIVLGLTGALGLALDVFVGGAPAGLATALAAAAAIFLLLSVVTLVVVLPQAWRLIRTGLLSQPPDAILRDVGRAVLDGLRLARLVSDKLHVDFVRVVEQPDASYEVLLDYASPEDAAIFIAAYGQVFEPVRDQRYLILRDDQRVPSMYPLWLLVRGLARSSGLQGPAYHPVPAAFSTRERANAYARAWAHYVGGGRLVYTRTDEGRRILYAARGQRRPNAREMAFETWR